MIQVCLVNNVWSYGITVIMPDCLSGDRGSTPLKIAFVWPSGGTADAEDSKSSVRNSVRVQVSPGLLPKTLAAITQFCVSSVRIRYSSPSTEELSSEVEQQIIASCYLSQWRNPADASALEADG